MLAVPCLLSGAAAQQPVPARPPNLIVILADDLGYGDLGCYGQRRIHTPVLDRLAREGMRFTSAYSGSAVCAPARCALLTGMHTGHAQVRNNRELPGAGTPAQRFGGGPEQGQHPLREDSVTIATVLKQAGYRTAAIGKWGLGARDSTGNPNRHGFDLFFGSYCQRHAHDHYPAFLWRNGERVPLPGNHARVPHQRVAEPPAADEIATRFGGATYAADAMTEAALAFLRQESEQPFFLYFAPPLVHLALQVPDESLAEYSAAFDETPYLGERGYTPHPKPRAAYAAMVSHLDRAVGRIVAEIGELGLAEHTIVLFTSDNGATYTGGFDLQFFQSNGILRGTKEELYEGGIRVPLIAWGPGLVPGSSTCARACAAWDLLPTLAELAGAEPPEGIDGTSFVPALRGREQPQPAALYWEIMARGGQQAVLLEGRWKAIRRGLRSNGDAPVELYDLAEDPGEQHDVAAQENERVQAARRAFAMRTPAELPGWNW